MTPFRDLGEFFDLAEEADAENEYAVAWIDQLAFGQARRPRPADDRQSRRHGSRRARSAGSRLGVPFQPPVNVLSTPFLKLFNFAYRTREGQRPVDARSAYQGFFFPLDGVRDWNRLYGPQRPLPASERGAGVAARRRDRRSCSTSPGVQGRGLSSQC